MGVGIDPQWWDRIIRGKLFDTGVVGNQLNLNGAKVNAANPANGDALIYDQATNTWIPGTISGAVTSVQNTDGTLVISPTTGNVIASLNLGNPNTWLALQTFKASLGLAGATSGVLTMAVPSTVTSYTITWPNAPPSVSGQVLSSDTSGTLSWISTSSIERLATTGTSGIGIGTSSTTILSYTPTANLLVEVRIVFSCTVATTLTATLTYTDPVTGSVTATIISNRFIVVGVNTVSSFMINSTASAITLSATAGASPSITCYSSFYSS